jgi:hypothetical protein
MSALVTLVEIMLCASILLEVMTVVARRIMVEILSSCVFQLKQVAVLILPSVLVVKILHAHQGEFARK